MSIPNLLSVFRIVLLPVFVTVFILAEPRYYYWLAIILIVSGLSDILDGIIARKFNQVTQLGKFLDPLADKLTVATVLACLAFLHPQVLFVLVVYVLKELLMGGGFLLLSKKKIALESSKWFGKMATVVTYIVMFLLIIIPNISDTWMIVLNTLVVAVTVFAFVMYAADFVKICRRQQEQ